MLDASDLFTERDFKDLMYDIYAIDQEVNLMSKLPGLKKMPAFLRFNDPNLPRNKVIRYIVYCYDRDSPIVKKFRQDDKKRKTLSAHYAGFQEDVEGLFDVFVDDFMKGKNSMVNSMIIDYVRQYNDPEYSLLVTGQEALYQKMELVISQEDSEKRDMFQVSESKGKLFDQATKMGADIDAIATKILGDENRFLKRDLYSLIDEKIKNRLPIGRERLLGLD